MKQLGLFDAWDPLAHDCAIDLPNNGGRVGRFVRLYPRRGGARRAELHFPDLHAGVGTLDPWQHEPRFARFLCRGHVRFEGAATQKPRPLDYTEFSDDERTRWSVPTTGPWGGVFVWFGDLRRDGHLFVECVRSAPIASHTRGTISAAKRAVGQKATVKT